MSTASTNKPVQRAFDRRTIFWLAGVAGVIALWFVIYCQLVPFSEWAVSRLPLAPGGHAHEAVKFFLDHRDAYSYSPDNPSNPSRYLEPPSHTKQAAAFEQ